MPTSSAHSQTTSADSTTVASVTVPTNTTAVYIAVTTTKVYMTFDGSTPSSSNGTPVVAGALPLFLSAQFPTSTIKWIGSATATHIVDILFLTRA